jgi:hypothetical protein
MNPSTITEQVEQSKLLEDFGKKTKSLYEELIQDIQNGKTTEIDSKICELSTEELELLVRETQSYKSLGPASSQKQVIAAVSNLRENYIKKLITTSMVSFLFQMQSEYEVSEDDLISPPSKDDFKEDGPAQMEVLNYNKFYTEALINKFREAFPEQPQVVVYADMESQLSENDLLDVANNASTEMKKLSKPTQVVNQTKYLAAIEAAVKEQSASDRIVINKFLKKMFHYDPVEHVQEGLQPNVHGDPERSDTSKYEHIPPNDTHCRFNSYYEVNYERLRQATLDIYNVKPDLEHAMIVYDVVDTQKDVDVFIQKYGSTSKYDILSFPLNCWTLMGPFKENRSRIDYYNKNNQIIKSMLEQQEKDVGLKEELMKKRIKTKKVRSEKVFGKDSPEFEQYRKMNPSELESKYGVTMEDTEDGSIKIVKEMVVNAETGKKLTLDEDGVPVDGLEVPITTINAQTGETTKTRFFTEAQD